MLINIKGLLLFSWCYLVILVAGDESWRTWNYDDLMGTHDRREIIKITKDVVVDAKYKFRQLNGIRDEYFNRIEFQIGIVIGKCREKYKRMMDIYRDLNERWESRQNILGPGFRRWKPIFALVALEKMRAKEREIETLVQVLENIPRREIALFKYDNQGNVSAVDKGNENNETLKIEMQKREEEAKNHLRQNYEQKHKDGRIIDIKKENEEGKQVNWLLTAY